MRIYIAIHSGRGWGKGREVEALIASAGVDAIGSALLRLRLLNDAKAFPVALRMLQPVVRTKLKRAGLATTTEAGKRATTKGLRAWIALKEASEISVGRPPARIAARRVTCWGSVKKPKIASRSAWLPANSNASTGGP